MLTNWGRRKRRWRTRFSRTHWLARWLGLQRSTQPSDQHGIIVVQLDGLARKQFEEALRRRRLPFLRKLIERHYSRLTSFYSGLPSTTPAVQAEVMYGVKTAVPAFQFYSRQQQSVRRMFECESARSVVAGVLRNADPLLKDGSSYSNIYSGGSSDAFCCSETADVASVLKWVSIWRVLLFLPLYFFTILRIIALTCIEVMIALGDALYAVVHRREAWKEIKFIQSRVLVCILMRELVRILAKLAIERGQPIVYVNFLGYDEQSHRRGPSSRFDPWGLKGIDRVIQDIFQTAIRSDARDYDVIIFSDHGQQEVRIHEYIAGKPLEQAVHEAMQGITWPQEPSKRSEHKRRGRDPWRQRLQQVTSFHQSGPNGSSDDARPDELVITALGPLGHIYFPQPFGAEELDQIAKRLVHEHRVPLVMYRHDDRVIAHNLRGRWTFPDQFEEACGQSPFFSEEIKEDLRVLCHHPDAGDLVISGWDGHEVPMTFVRENGSHGSFGSEETRGFMLWPMAVPLTPRRSKSGEEYVRGVDLHEQVRGWLHPDRPASRLSRSHTTPSPTSLRFVTYNAHSCIGVDGKYRIRRIAEVLGRLDADVIALQEIDAFRERTRLDHQAQQLADRLGMEHAFFPVCREGAQQYGLALLSRYPMRLQDARILTEARPHLGQEARGAMWATIETDRGPLEVINTHLGLKRVERLLQIEGLLQTWLKHLAQDAPVVLCGDFNAGPKSEELRRLHPHLRSVQTLLDRHRPKASFPSMLPLRQLDYILVSKQFSVESVQLPRSHLTAVASDHLPVAASVIWQAAARQAS